MEAAALRTTTPGGSLLLCAASRAGEVSRSIGVFGAPRSGLELLIGVSTKRVRYYRGIIFPYSPLRTTKGFHSNLGVGFLSREVLVSRPLDKFCFRFPLGL